MICIFSILEFYQGIERQELYLRYLYKLVEFHLECENFVEAAYTLELHKRLLHWSDEPLPTMLKSDAHPDCSTHRVLKECLCLDIIEYFDCGKLWRKVSESAKNSSKNTNKNFSIMLNSRTFIPRCQLSTRKSLTQCDPNPSTSEWLFMDQDFQPPFKTRSMSTEAKNGKNLLTFRIVC